MPGSKGYIVAIDGPSGAGKSTLSTLLSKALGGILLDTGAMYRSVAFFSLNSGANSPAEFGRIASGLVFRVGKNHQLLINGKVLGAKIRTEEVSRMASHVSQYAQVRSHLTAWQRRLARDLSRRVPVVIEGRDIGTIVFPNLRFKFFVTADPSTRARRRLDQLKKAGVKGITLDEILKQNIERDRQDTTRKIAPLKCPKDAVVVDTSRMPIEQVVQFIQTHIERVMGGAGIGV